MTPDEIWDEDRWEDFLREHDRHFDRFMTDVHAFMRIQPPPPEEDPSACGVWKADLLAFLKRKGWRYFGFFSSEFDLDASGEGLPGVPDDPAHDDDEPEPEVLRPTVYDSACRLGTRVIQWANALPGYQKDSTLVQFCSHVMEVGAGVARGHAMGYEQESIGGNIAWMKRALKAANLALECLHEMKPAPYMRPEPYRALYEQTYEVRNDLALHILTLRERFRLGVD